MKVSLTIDADSFDLGHMSLVDLIDQLEDIDMNEPLLERLAHHPEPCVRIAVSRKQFLNPETVRFLHEENSIPEIQKNIMTFQLTSPGMTYEALMNLVEEGGDELLLLANQVDQLHLKEDELKSLITSLTIHSISTVRMMLAKNKRLPEWALRKLTHDDDELVVQRAQRSLALQHTAARNSDMDSVHLSLEPKAFSSMANLMQSNYKELEELYSGRYDGSEKSGFHWDEPERHKTGIDDIDLMTGGMRPGEITLIVGLLGSGTTSLALNMAAGVGLHPDHRDKEGGKVVLFSMQHVEEELSMRMLASESGVNFEQMRLGQFTTDAWRSLAAASGALAESNIHFIHVPDISIYEVMVACRKITQSVDPIDLVIIDRIDLMNPFADQDKREQEFGEMIERVRAMVVELDVPVLLTASLPKQMINQQTIRGWSKSLFDGADTVMQLERQGKDAELKMYKHITLPASSVRLSFDSGTMRFDSASKNWS